MVTMFIGSTFSNRINSSSLAIHQSRSPLQGLKILVVDNHPDSLELLTIIFAEYGVETTTATTSAEALKLIERHPPDLLISEIFLPCEDGYSLMHKVKALEVQQHRHIPSIALTVCAGKKDRQRALSVGFSQHLPKPFDIEELIAVIMSLVNKN